MRYRQVHEASGWCPLPKNIPAIYLVQAQHQRAYRHDNREILRGRQMENRAWCKHKKTKACMGHKAEEKGVGDTKEGKQCSRSQRT